MILRRVEIQKMVRISSSFPSGYGGGEDGECLKRPAKAKRARVGPLLLSRSFLLGTNAVHGLPFFFCLVFFRSKIRVRRRRRITHAG